MPEHIYTHVCVCSYTDTHKIPISHPSSGERPDIILKLIFHTKQCTGSVGKEERDNGYCTGNCLCHIEIDNFLKFCPLMEVWIGSRFLLLQIIF